MEAMQAQLQAMASQMQQSEARTIAMGAELDRLRAAEQQAAAAAQADNTQQPLMQQQTDLLAQLAAATTHCGEEQRPVLVDTMA